mmetsp:Transcript_10386/g.12044  ORF Transcript_10386/g.12044 Transcript_10386/m.12044 type:complete len:147 (+) Transcript_10386:157-597(+)
MNAMKRKLEETGVELDKAKRQKQQLENKLQEKDDMNENLSSLTKKHVMQLFQKARKTESCLISKLQEDHIDWSLDELKELMVSLHSRLKMLQDTLKPDAKISPYEVLMDRTYKLDEKGVKMTQEDVIYIISGLQEELLKLECMFTS